MLELSFWLFELVIVMLIPGIMVFFGRRFITKPPKEVNSAYGYRTTRSMRNQQTWDFAHQVCGNVWRKLGMILLFLSAAAFLPLFGADVGTLGKWSVITVVIQCIAMLLTFIPVERALKREFDEFGRKRV